MLKNVASQSVGVQMITAADGTAFTGAVTVAVTGDAGTQATGSVGSGACTHEGNGYHTYAPAQAETNYDLIAFTFTGTGAIPVTIQVYTDATYDRLGAPAGASIAADIATVDTNVDAVLVDTGTTIPGTITTIDNEIAVIDANVDAILADTAEIGAAGAGLTAVPWNASWDAEVQSEVQDAIEANNLDHLLAAAVTGADVVDDSVFAQLVSSAATADWDTFVNTTDAMQALRDRGDSAWTTGGGGSITDIVQWQPLVPSAIDLANTAAWQLGIAVTNQVDDLPTTAEITPGTISIDRKAQGGTTWSAVVTDAAMSEIAGLIYYDEVFDTATGYEAGDVLRITFKNQVVTVSANDYEITGATGRVFYSAIIADTPDVNIAQINGSSTNVAAMNTFFSLLNGSGQIQASTIATDTLTAAKFQDGALTAAKFGSAFLTATSIGADAFTAAKFAADVTSELQSGLATSAEVAALNDLSAADVNAQVVDALATDTYAELSSVPAANAPIADKLNFLFALARNKITQTASTQALRNDADSGNIGTAGVSDSGTTFTRDEWT